MPFFDGWTSICTLVDFILQIYIYIYIQYVYIYIFIFHTTVSNFILAVSN